MSAPVNRAAPPLALYLHFPWCVRKCPYCDFNSHAVQNELPEASYLAALEQDLEVQGARHGAGREIVSIFLGGGTPSLFSPAAIGRVLARARAVFTVAADAEITLEANPGTIERGRFAEYRAAGVTRVSLGAQSFASAKLEILGRIHSPDDTRRAAAELHAAGLANFNLDLMYALPGQSVAEALSDIEQALALEPAHLSHYELTLEPGTLFGARPPAGLPADDTAAEMLEICTARLAAGGFRQYEVSGYAREGLRCRHNLNYWTFGDYIGVGAGAHGKLTVAGVGDAALTVLRTVQQREPRRYLAAAPESCATRVVPAADLPFEFMMNALRLVDGFEPSLFAARTGLPWQCIALLVDGLVARGLLTFDARRCAPTARGLRFLNEALLTFLPAAAPYAQAVIGRLK
jgi:putative oxygen-independent coproporphyrinogen III oxidase